MYLPETNYDGGTEPLDFSWLFRERHRQDDGVEAYKDVFTAFLE